MAPIPTSLTVLTAVIVALWAVSLLALVARRTGLDTSVAALVARRRGVRLKITRNKRTGQPTQVWRVR